MGGGRSEVITGPRGCIAGHGAELSSPACHSDRRHTIAPAGPPMRLFALIILLACTGLSSAQSEQPVNGLPEAAPGAVSTPGDTDPRPSAEGVFGYLSQVPPDQPLPPYSVVEIAHAIAAPAMGDADAAWTVVLAAGPVGMDCTGTSDGVAREPCAVFTLARDGRVLSGRWHGSQPYAFRTDTMRADVTAAGGWLRGRLHTVDESQFTPDSAVVNVRLDVRCPDCE